MSRPNRWLWAVASVVFPIAVWMLWRLWISADIEEGNIFHPWGLALAFFLAVSQQVLSVVPSILALGAVGCRAPFFSMLWISMFSTTANSSAPFPAGLPIRAVLQKKILAIPLTSSAGAMAIEAAIAYGSAVVIGLASGAIWLRPVLGEKISTVSEPLFIAFFVMGVILTVGLACGIAARFRGRLMERLREAWRLIIGARRKPLGAMLLLTLLNLAMALLRTYMVLYAIGASISPGPLFAAIVLAHMLGILSFLPMGLGARDVSLASFLILLGASVEQAAAMAAIDRLLITAPYLIGGAVGAYALGKEVLENGAETDEKRGENTD